VVDKADHARKRKTLASAFAAKNLEGWEFKVADKTNRLCTQLERHSREAADQPLNFRAFANFYTIDCLSDICISEETRTIDRCDDTVTAESIGGERWQVGWRTSLYSSFEGTGDLVWAYRWYGTLVQLSQKFSAHYARLWSQAAGWGGLVQHLCEKRWARYDSGEKLQDIFQALMEDGSGEPNDLEWGEVVAEINLAISGSSSTSNSIASILFQLLETPRTWRKLQEEVDAALGDGNEGAAPYDVVKHLPYLRACIDEGLRMFPPISHALPRQTPPEGMAVEGDWIGGRTTVGISAFIAGRDPKVFPDPHTYRPERWLGEEGKQLQPAFLAFSAGARGCIGRPVSYLMLSVLIATLARRFDLSLWQEGFKPTRRETMNLICGSVPIRVKIRSTGDVQMEAKESPCSA
jgi:cytochrome P450